MLAPIHIAKSLKANAQAKTRQRVWLCQCGRKRKHEHTTYHKKQ